MRRIIGGDLGLGKCNGYGYEYLSELALNFASTHQDGNSAAISKVGENKQLLIAIVIARYFLFLYSSIASKNFIPPYSV